MIVFTNGCFDILHPGHVDLLERAKALGTRLIVGINSDESVRKIKGSGRPFMMQGERAAVLMGLQAVDEVRIFDEMTPERLIREIRPDVLVKGGDWKPEEIIGSDFVTANGGKVLSLPLMGGFSTSGIADRICAPNGKVTAAGGSLASRSLAEHESTIRALTEQCTAAIEDCGRVITDTIHSGRKVLICGNGGSAADAQHIAAEFVGRYETERIALPAIALTTDTSALTALANDYDFERIFARQVDALANEGDCLIAISTSGNSANVLAAVMAARKKGCRIVGMTGANGKKLAGLSDVCLLVPSARTARIQEAHITVAHIWCEMVDAAVSV
jgi:D-sedoheptulose 7-phosphate isomerase